jgi:hypothetical protein
VTIDRVAHEVWLALGYAAFLGAAAFATHRRARRTLAAARGNWPLGEAALIPEAVAALLAGVAAFVLLVTFARHPELPDVIFSGGGLVVLALFFRFAWRRRRGRET